MNGWCALAAANRRMNKPPFHIDWLCCVVLLWGMSVVAHAGDIRVVGVLENPQCAQTSTTVVRPLFRLDSSGWRAVDAHSEQWDDVVDWNLAQSDNASRKIETIAPKSTPGGGAMLTRRNNVFKLRANQRLVPAPNRTGEFAGWCDAPARRPLIVSTGAMSGARGAWFTERRPLKIPANVFRAFRQAVTAKQLCVDRDRPTRYRFREADVRLARDIQTKDGGRLFAIALKVPAFECESELGEVIGLHWLHVGKRVQLIGTNMQLVDVADLDGNGRPEYVFWLSGYNEDGYAMFTSSFAQRITYTWKYH